MPSHRANRFGTRCEYHLAEKYHLELERASWKDARDSDGNPWELKATRRTHSDGQPGNFKIYRKYHAKLARAGGVYGFAVYRVRGTGAQVLRTTAMPARKVPTLTWHGGGDHRDTEQAKLPITDVF